MPETEYVEHIDLHSVINAKRQPSLAPKSLKRTPYTLYLSIYSSCHGYKIIETLCVHHSGIMCLTYRRQPLKGMITTPESLYY